MQYAYSTMHVFPALALALILVLSLTHSAYVLPIYCKLASIASSSCQSAVALQIRIAGVANPHAMYIYIRLCCVAQMRLLVLLIMKVNVKYKLHLITYSLCRDALLWW
jgi:hypothetical protein